jgi:hypothetical protein
MAKSQTKERDPLGKLIAEGDQSPRKLGLVIPGGLVVAVGAGLLLSGLLVGPVIALIIVGAVLAVIGFVVIRRGVGFLQIHFEIRKRGIRHQTPFRELEVEWEEIDSVLIQMISENVLLNFTGVNDVAEYIHKRSNYQPFQVQIKTKNTQFFSFNSGMLPPLTGRAVLEKLAASVPDSAVAYELFTVLPKLTDDD